MIRSSANPAEARARLMGMEVSAEILRRALNDPEAKAADQPDPDAGRRDPRHAAPAAHRPGGRQARRRSTRASRPTSPATSAILADEQLILDLIRADLREMKAKYANPRRSVISDEELGDYDKEALIREEYMVVTVTHDGYIKRLPPSTYRAQNRGGRGITATNTKEGDFLEHMFVALTHDYILFFTDHGKVYWLKVYDLPMATRTSGGRAIVNLLQLGEGEKITGLIPVREFHEDECLMMVTRRGTVKKTELTAFKPPAGPRDHRPGPRRGRPADRRRPHQGRRPGGPEHHARAWRSGSTSPTSARWAGPAYGVKGIDLAEGDEVVGMVVANGDDDPASLLTVCANGFGKRTALTEYRSQNRGGKGLIDIKTTDRNGPVVAIAKVTDADEVMLTTTGGILIRTARRRHAPDRPQHPGRPPDPRRGGRHRQQPGQAPRGGARRPTSSSKRDVDAADGTDRPRPGRRPSAPHPRRRRRPRPRPATISTRVMSRATARPRCE